MCVCVCVFVCVDLCAYVCSPHSSVLTPSDEDWRFGTCREVCEQFHKYLCVSNFSEYLYSNTNVPLCECKPCYSTHTHLHTHTHIHSHTHIPHGCIHHLDVLCNDTNCWDLSDPPFNPPTTHPLPTLYPPTTHPLPAQCPPTTHPLANLPLPTRDFGLTCSVKII